MTLGAAVLSLGLLGTAAIAGDIVTFSTDQTGANVTIDVGNTEVYDFVVNQGHTVSEIIGSFDIKEGSSTSQPISFGIFNQFNNTGHKSGAFTPSGTQLGHVSLGPAGIPQNFTVETFDITGLNLNPGSYSAVLSSAATGNGSDQYFFKNQNFSSNSPAVSVGQAPVAGAPEPGGLALVLGMSLPLAGFALRRRRKNNGSRA